MAMTESIRSIEQLNNEITNLREQNRTLSEELDFHRRIFSRVNQVLGAIAHVDASLRGNEAIKQLLYENAKLKNELKISRLSEREREVLKLIAQGNTSKKIADVLNISKLTVDTHRKRIQQKLEVSNMVELIKVAMTFDLK
jgi:DNA-binding CsgD family transcriptional regulator